MEPHAPYSSFVVANEFIRLAQKGGGITHMQLQKLVYFAHVESLLKFNKPLVKGVFQAWPFGPVDVAIYSKLRGSGRKKITSQIVVENKHSEMNLDIESKNLIEQVYNKLKDKKAWDLSKETHIKGGPWHEVYKEGWSNPIQNERIKNLSRSIFDE